MKAQARELTRDNLTTLHHWAPSTVRHATDGTPIGLTVFTPSGRVTADFGDIIVRHPDGTFDVHARCDNDECALDAAIDRHPAGQKCYRWELTVHREPEGNWDGVEVLGGASCPATDEQIRAATAVLAGIDTGPAPDTVALLHALVTRLGTETDPHRGRASDDIVAAARAHGWDDMRRLLAHETGADITPPRPPAGPPCLTVVQEHNP